MQYRATVQSDFSVTVAVMREESKHLSAADENFARSVGADFRTAVIQTSLADLPTDEPLARKFSALFSS